MERGPDIGPGGNSISDRYHNLTEKKRALLDAWLKKQKEKRGNGSNDKKANRGQTGGRGLPSPLIAMKPSGSRSPFFCVHALLGSVFHYYPLANMMDREQPFYALQAPGLDGAEKPLDQIEALAHRYIEAIRSVRPNGPYKLGGYSFGGWVAFEMARQLVEAGETVAALIIFGSAVPLSTWSPPLSHLVGFVNEYVKHLEKNIVAPLFSHEQRIAAGVGRSRLNHPLLRLAKAHYQAAFAYTPMPYPGKINLLETVEQQVLNPFDPSRGWGRLSARKVETEMVSGNHLSMLDEPYIHDLSKKLNAHLEIEN